jgi:hypothetical protein
LVRDVVRLDGIGYDMRARCAWLLQTSRLALLPGTSRKQFAQRLADQGLPGNESQLSRWESGERPVSRAIACGYEEALSVPPGRLCAALDYLKVSPLSSRPKPRDSRPGPEDESLADEAFDRILSGTGTGEDWRNATRFATSSPTTFLPRPIWRQLTATLLSELYRSVGPAYAARMRALSLILDGHPRETTAIEAVRDFATTNRSQALTITAMSMIHANSPLANQTSLEWLAHPDAGAQWGAVNAVALKLELGHYTTADLPLVEQACLAMVSSPAGRPSGLALLRGLPPEARARVTQSVRNGDQLLKELFVEGPPPSWRTYCRNLARGATARAAFPGLEGDPMVEMLLLESLFGTHYEGRYVAALCLSSSPYRSHVAGELVADLLDGTCDFPEQSAWLLNFLADAEHEDGLVDAVQLGPSPLTTNLLFMALGGVPTAPTQRAVDLALDILQGENPLPMRGTSFMLGMHEMYGSVDLTGTAPWVGPIAEWWRSQGGAVRA